MNKTMKNLEIFTRDLSKPLPPDMYEVEDCGGGERDAKVWSVVLTIISAAVFALAIYGG